MKPVNLLLVGRTGNGKSSTGNSILGWAAFKASMNSEPFTEEDIKQATTMGGDPQITVVDGPGIGDANLSDPGEVQTTITLTERALGYCRLIGGFHAVLVILKYGERFTKQEKDAVEMVKAILGLQVLARHGVVVMTRGDNFEIDEEENGLSFEDWCRLQTGDVAELFQECNHRIVLFNNRIKEARTLDKQREDLLAVVFKFQSSPYTQDDYDNAKEDRLRLTVSSNFNIMERENKQIVNQINADINRLDISRKPHEAINKLTSLELELDSYKQKLDAQTQGTDVDKRLLAELNVVGMAVTTKRNLAESYLQLEQEDQRGSTKHRLSASRHRVKEGKHDTKGNDYSKRGSSKHGHIKQSQGAYCRLPKEIPTERKVAWPPTNERSQTFISRGPSSPQYNQTSASGSPPSPQYNQTSVSGGPSSPQYNQTSVSGGPSSPQYNQTSVSGGPSSPQYNQTSVSGGPSSSRDNQTSVSVDPSSSGHNKKPDDKNKRGKAKSKKIKSFLCINGGYDE